MTSQRSDFLTRNKKELSDLAKTLLKTLPSIGFEFSRRDSFMANITLPRHDEATYTFIAKKDKKQKIVYEYTLSDSGVYTASIDMGTIPESSYDRINSLLTSGFSRLLTQRVA